MIKSVIVRRIMILLAISLMLSATLSAVIYFYTTRSYFTKIKAAELIPRAETIADMVEQYQRGYLPEVALARLLSSDSTLWDAQLYIFDTQGSLFISQRSTSENALSANLEPGESVSNVVQNLRPLALEILKGRQISTNVALSGNQVDSLVVGVPIGKNPLIHGAVVLSKPLPELYAAFQSMNTTLTTSVFFAFALVLISSVVVSHQIIRPLNRVRNAAMAIADGQFHIRADEKQKGEIGELAFSLNHLSSRLSRTIADLELERGRLLEILDGLSEGIVALDAAGTITHINPKLLKLFNHKEAPPGADPLSLIPDQDLWNRFITAMKQKTTVSFTMTVRSAILGVTLTPLKNDDHQIVGAVGLFRDITESERLEQTRRDYVANVSHELRTPIASLRSLAEALKDDLIHSDKDKQRYYGYILRESMRLSQLIDDLLELSRLQSGAVALKPQSVDLKALLPAICEPYRITTDEIGIQFELPDNLEHCPDIFGNPDRIEQVLHILLDNAIKFTSEDGLVSLKVAWDQNKVYLSVRDTGQGISEQDLPYVFERFYKADKAHSGMGTGLGLSIAREILSLMDERIWAESRLHEGSCFTFTLSANHPQDLGQNNALRWPHEAPEAAAI
ncbi:MAG: HAMP domain-containing protein [Peptococcaceae bacterium]|jgi:two-component system sensor histidine kinase ResE|nr:HAMP domain-containing protein [Peptococcaceae bacterium]